jgi:transcription initiation factor TFIIIB Brf1 subunit/transcription initiation factor TFIIB
MKKNGQKQEPEGFDICPVPGCGGTKQYTDKERGIYFCDRCGAVPAGLEFDE